MKKSWMYVALTCLFELLWVFGLNRADAVWEWAIIICLIPVDFYFLMKACEKSADWDCVRRVCRSWNDWYVFDGLCAVRRFVFIRKAFIYGHFNSRNYWTESV